MKKESILITALSIFLIFISSHIIGQEKTLVICGDDNFPPFEFINADGEADGFNVDIITEIARRANLNYNLNLINWSDAIKGFNEGSIDIITGTTDNHGWGSDVFFGIPYYTVKLCIASRKEDHYSSISELAGKDVVVRGGAWSESFLKDNDIARNIIVIGNIDSAIISLSKGEYDAILNSSIGTMHSIKKNKIRDILVKNTYIHEEDFSFCLKSGNAETLSAMNKALDQMKIDGTYDKIYGKWFKDYEKNFFEKYYLYILTFIVLISFILVFLIIKSRHKEIATSLDLSESQKSLKEKNEQLELILTAGNIIPLFWDLTTDRIYITSKKAKGSYSTFNPQIQHAPSSYTINNVHPDDRKAVASVFNSILNDEKEDITAEARYDVTGKYEKYFSFHLVVNERDKNGKPLSAVGYMQDITSNKREEALRKQNETFLRDVLNTIPFPVEVKDVEDNYKYIFWNNQSTIEYGDCHLQSITSLLPAEEAEKVHKIDREVYDTGKVYFNQETLHTLDGKVHQTIVQKSPIIVNGKKMILIVRWDIGNVKELEKGLDIAMRELEKAKNDAVQASQLKSAFLANMSHEIRTPLNAIVGFSQLIGTAETDKEKEEFSNIISTNCDNLLRLINDILDMSKIEAGYIEIKKIDLDLTKLFKMLYTTFSQKMKPEVALMLDSPYESCTINADKNRITQVITNFMTNAIKFTSKGSITMGYKALDDNTIRFWVTDTGCGIAQENKHRVFGRFKKLNNIAQGNGLGLSICKTIIETSGGKIGFESELEKGSTFWAELPTPVSIAKL